MIILSANPDAYGRHATASALADFIELLALRSFAFTRSDLIDFMVDNGWHLKVRENVVGADEESDDDSEETQDAASRIYGLLQERQLELGDWYPFDMDAAGRLLRRNRDAKHDRYLLLLSLTTAHAHRVPTGRSPTDVFPETVCRTFVERGWRAANFGATPIRGKQFVDALLQAGDELGVTVDPNAAPRSGRAQDAGADCLSYYPWDERRAGRWWTITQVTCANSGEWRQKLFDAPPSPWRARLTELAEPRIALAVPHHVEPAHRSLLFSEGNGRVLVLDRLSLTRYLPAVMSPGELEIYQQIVTHVSVEHP
jgi:hypothetical protein